MTKECSTYQLQRTYSGDQSEAIEDVNEGSASSKDLEKDSKETEKGSSVKPLLSATENGIASTGSGHQDSIGDRTAPQDVIEESSEDGSGQDEGSTPGHGSENGIPPTSSGGAPPLSGESVPSVKDSTARALLFRDSVRSRTPRPDAGERKEMSTPPLSANGSAIKASQAPQVADSTQENGQGEKDGSKRSATTGSSHQDQGNTREGSQAHSANVSASQNGPPPPRTQLNPKGQGNKVKGGLKWSRHDLRAPPDDHDLEMGYGSSPELATDPEGVQNTYTRLVRMPAARIAALFAELYHALRLWILGLRAGDEVAPAAPQEVYIRGSYSSEVHDLLMPAAAIMGIFAQIGQALRLLILSLKAGDAATSAAARKDLDRLGDIYSDSVWLYGFLGYLYLYARIGVTMLPRGRRWRFVQWPQTNLSRYPVVSMLCGL
ncbi:unnamed protein product [Microthlaspi erraticum]|uniref:Uncharacterized protein n=1 Tax=Microthlaspi erraticum TaxID=1685480 RepID=A0A6D2JX84_9BRAS|nr:unnamed protein product [Microthlaspi erraticum]